MGLLLTKPLLFFVLSAAAFLYSLIQAPKTRRNFLTELNGNVDNLAEALNVVNNYPQLMRECLLGLLESLLVLLRAALVLLLRDNPELLRPSFAASIFVQLVIFALYKF